MKGFSSVEVLLAVAVFALAVTAYMGAFVVGQESGKIAGDRVRATVLAKEGLEATRNIRDESYGNLADGTYGLAVSGNIWTFSGSSDTTGAFSRSVTIAASGTNRKQVTATVTWQAAPSRTGSVSLVTNLTNWVAAAGGGPTATPTPTPPLNTCTSFCATLGSYSGGTCRPEAVLCTSNGETHETLGDVLCTGGAEADTCCCAP